MAEGYINIEDRISAAYEAYQTHKKPNIKALSRDFDVPYSRLLVRIRGRKSRSMRQPTNKALDKAQEAALIQWITCLDKAYALPTAATVEQCANAILRRNNIERSLRQG